MSAAARRERVHAAAAALRERTRSEPRWHRVVWIVVAALLVAGPVAFDLARSSRFSASIELFPRPVRPYPPVTRPDYYRGLMADPELRVQTRINAGATLEHFRSVSIRPTARGTLLLTIGADTPAAAPLLVNVIAKQIAGATRRQLAAEAEADEAQVRALLRRHLPRRRRRSLTRGRRQLARLAPTPPERIVLGRYATQLRLKRWADRLADRLPGDFPTRPSPVFVGLTGLLVALALWALSLALFPRTRPVSGAA